MTVQICSDKDAACEEFPTHMRCENCPTLRAVPATPADMKIYQGIADNYRASLVTQPAQTAAIKTLEHLGYTYHGAEYWKPPIGPLPTHILGWQPIETAPTDNSRLLYLARFDAEGDLMELDYDGIWEYWQESWEMPHINGWCWMSANGIEDPTHWAYQDAPIPLHPRPHI